METKSAPFEDAVDERFPQTTANFFCGGRCVLDGVPNALFTSPSVWLIWAVVQAPKIKLSRINFFMFVLIQ